MGENCHVIGRHLSHIRVSENKIAFGDFFLVIPYIQNMQVAHRRLTNYFIQITIIIQI